MTAVALHNPQRPAAQQVSVIAAMADQYGMRADAFEATLRATVVPKACTREEFAAFVLVARQYKLNPITREIYAIPKKGGGIQPVVGVDGWYSIMNEHPQFDGIEFDEHVDDHGNLTATTCRIWRKDRTRPIVVTEYLAECKQGTEPWQKWPRRMLRHKAGIQCARVAFGFSGIVDPDEAERFTAPQDTMRGYTREQTIRELKTIDARLSDFGAETDDHTDSAAVSSAFVADTPASPAASDPAEDAGTPDPVEEARQAGRDACRNGLSFDAVPKKYARYVAWGDAWRDGYQQEGERIEAEMNQ